MTSPVLNLIIALIWLALSDEPSLTTFAIGMLIGFVMLAAFHGVHGSWDYVRRVRACLRFVFVFIAEFLKANLVVLKAVLFQPREAFYPNFITYDVTGMNHVEIMLMYYCISLTPGSAAVSLNESFDTMIIHVLDARDPDAVRRELDEVLKKGIFAFTR